MRSFDKLIPRYSPCTSNFQLNREDRPEWPTILWDSNCIDHIRVHMDIYLRQRSISKTSRGSICTWTLILSYLIKTLRLCHLKLQFSHPKTLLHPPTLPWAFLCFENLLPHKWVYFPFTLFKSRFMIFHFLYLKVLMRLNTFYLFNVTWDSNY